MRRVVVTGIGAITPIGNNISELWEGLKEGKSGAADITIWDASMFKTTFACEVKDFDPQKYIDRREARRMDRFTQFSMVAADEAIQDCGIDFESHFEKDGHAASRVGVIWGAGIGGLLTLEGEIEAYAKGSGTPRFNPFLIPKMIVDIVPGLISIKYGLKGINYATVSACASSAHAIINAYDSIKLGRADVMVTGGSEAAITHAGIGGFTSMKAMSERNDEPQTASRPFDKNRDGFVLGEGAASLVLEDYDHAKARGAKIYAELVGIGMSADAYHMTAPHPEGEGAASAMQLALDEAGVSTKDIDYINVHGTSTPLGDVAELNAIKRVFGDDAFDLNISSTKSMTGHLLGGAGAIEAVASILAINNNLVPPTINHTEADPEIDKRFNLTLNTAQERDVKVALSNAFGFGGHNTTLIFKEM